MHKHKTHVNAKRHTIVSRFHDLITCLSKVQLLCQFPGIWKVLLAPVCFNALKGVSHDRCNPIKTAIELKGITVIILSFYAIETRDELRFDQPPPLTLNFTSHNTQKTNATLNLHFVKKSNFAIWHKNFCGLRILHSQNVRAHRSSFVPDSCQVVVFKIVYSTFSASQTISSLLKTSVISKS